MLCCVGIALASFGYFTPSFFIPTYAVSQGLLESAAFYLLSAVNGASLLGRIWPGFMADRIGHFNIIVTSAFTSALVSFCWTAAKSLASLIVWNLAYGFVSGGILAMEVACPTLLVTEETHGAGVGIAMFASSFGSLFGTPIAGELVKRGYVSLSCFAATMLVAGGIMLTITRLLQQKRLFAKI